MSDLHAGPASSSEPATPVAATPGISTPVASLVPFPKGSYAPPDTPLIDRRVLLMCLLAIGLGIGAAFVAQLLIGLIALITNVAYFGQLSLELRAPADAIPRLGLWSIPIPIIGALVIGLMARYGSKAIRGHGIPEAMEQVLTNESRIPARITVLKPLSSAISIGTGGPFGAEGPIIATGGALGSVLGQVLHISATDRKTLLAAGAAAGMAATFGSPVSAVLLAIELLLFEFRPRSIIPVALAASAATGVRMAIEGMEPVFAMSNLAQPSGPALATYILLGAVMGVISVLVTKVVYAVEDAFEKLPIHWMWWPALGGLAVGVIGYFAPDTLGVGYYNIESVLSNEMTVAAIVFLCGMKFLSWSISLGSGTSGGTLAPLFTIGGGLGAVMGVGLAHYLPALGVDPRIAGLVGMAAIFAGASRAMLASAVFAFETTLQAFGLLPLLGGCAAAYLVASLLMRNSIMTEKIARRGVITPKEYVADALSHVLVRDVGSSDVIAIQAEQSIAETRAWLAAGGARASHQGFPVIDRREVLVGLITRRNLSDSSADPDRKITEIMCQPVRYVYDDCTVRQAANHMVNHGIGRLPIVSREFPHRLVGIITRSDVLSAYQTSIRETELQQPTISFWKKEKLRVQNA